MFKITYWFYYFLFKNTFLHVRMMYKELYIFSVWTSWVLRWVYMCETIMPIYVINISPPNDSSCPEKSYVLGNKICQFLTFTDWWTSGSYGSPSSHYMLSQSYPIFAFSYNYHISLSNSKIYIICLIYLEIQFISQVWVLDAYI